MICGLIVVLPGTFELEADEPDVVIEAGESGSRGAWEVVTACKVCKVCEVSRFCRVDEL